MSAVTSFLTGNKIINSAVLAWLIAQILKLVTEYSKTKKIDLRRLVGSGGMPSSHSAVAVATSVSTGFLCGAQSPIFAIVLIFSCIVMADAAGVRRSAGEQAKILNYMMENWNNKTPGMFKNKLKELVGHTPFQVLAGGALGALVASICLVL